MNGLALRINSSDKTKMNNLMNFEPVTVPTSVIIGSTNTIYQAFMQSSTVDEQLEILKKIFNLSSVNHDPDLIQFLAIVFLQAEVKHPIKCFLTRHITKNELIQQPFSEKLSQYIKNYTTERSSEYHSYSKMVSKITPCIENFSAGTAAVKLIEIELAEYLKASLECCVLCLSNSRSLSPTEKNEIYNLAHRSLRLLLYIVQKVNDGKTAMLISMFHSLRLLIKNLFFYEDAPMDTKTLSGILYLTMEIFENGPDSWVKILDTSQVDSYVDVLLHNESAQLALYSAIATVVSAEMLQSHKITEKSTLICLTQQVIAIGERSSSESIFTLGVTRTILQISKMLDRVSDNDLGRELVELLVVFVWGHLEHYMDSVRHLAAQALSNVVRYCTRIEKEGNPEVLNRLFRALSSLDRSRKSYYVSICALTTQLGATRVLALLPNIITDVIQALQIQAVQASATTALETLLQKHVRQTDSEILYEQWIVPILRHVGSNALDSSILNILENLMAKAVYLDQNLINYILPHIKETDDESSARCNLKCTLLLLSVARKSGVINRISTECGEGEWKGVISYEVLKMAAVDSVEETRILSLSLVCESPKSTEVFSPGDLEFVLWYLRYNINAQSPNFRQLTLSVMKKFTKRLEESYKVLKRRKVLNSDSNKGDYYLTFVERLRRQCFDSLLPGANYSRRFVALQVLAWSDDMTLDGYHREWKTDYVEKLLLHLEDSYENNKALALHMLDKCPRELIKSKKYTVSVELEDILRQASSLKPTDCISAAYKLIFLKKKLPECIVQDSNNDTPDAVSYSLLRSLLLRVHRHLSTCQQSIVAAAKDAPMYGLLHCMEHVFQYVDHSAISGAQEWKTLIEEVIDTCMAVNASVSCVVNNSSPEGHLPMDAGGVAVNDYGNSGDVRLEDGRPVTAQMVLLCAWRSVKEVCLLLGTMSCRLSIEGEGQAAGSLSCDQLVAIGEHFITLLAEIKHRGAFEQAYVGFTRLLARVWVCRGARLHGRPRVWLRRLAAAVAEPTASATRRSAGLPYIVQALVTTELQVQGNPKCLHEIMTTLLKLAQRRSSPQQKSTRSDEPIKKCESSEDSEDDSPIGSVIHQESMSTESLVESRTHSLNILRALFRNSALEESLSGYVGEGLMVALTGFEGDTWMERNSSTLLFSALMVRVFGVWRPRASDRNRMTGRIFFLRYPALYDFILKRLVEAEARMQSSVRAGLFPTLVLLGRLYPSSLEGARSALRLRALAPGVAGCGSSPALAVRVLAAGALRPLLEPDQYIPHIESMLSIIADPAVKRNHCHGVLLQLSKLLSCRPDDLTVQEDADRRIVDKIKATYWILEQGFGGTPCYVIVDEYVKMINFLIWSFPSLVEPAILRVIKQYLDKILFAKDIPLVTLGRDICLSNAMYLNIVILNKTSTSGDIAEIIFKGLEHTSYDVVLSTLNYLLILYKNGDVDNCTFLEHLSTIQNENVLARLRENKDYVQKLCSVMKNSKYMECVQKTLKVLSLERDTQKFIVAVKLNKNVTDISNEEIIRKLFDCVQNEHENLTHIYLESLSEFVSEKLEDDSLNESTILDVIRVIFACSSSENSDSTRRVVTGFLERNFDRLMGLSFEHLDDNERFELKSTLLATTVTMLEDDDAAIRQRVSDVISRRGDVTAVIPTRAGEVLRDFVIEGRGEEGIAMLLLLALLDFRSEVCMSDEINDECRVFDQSERYNIFLEETVWTTKCAQKVINLFKDKGNVNIIEQVQSVIDNPTFMGTFQKLCNKNLVSFKRILHDNSFTTKHEVLNPKVESFINKLLEIE